MSGNSIYSTGWYSVSPAFAWWTFNVIVWLKSRHAEKQRELLKKINDKRKLTLQKLQREQFRYMHSKRSRKENK